MITQQVQVKLNLPLALKDYIESKAAKFDMPIAGYIKHLILKDVAEMDYPIYEISASSELKAKKALKEKKKSRKISDIPSYFNNL